jgi:hypothetical protein
MRNEMDDLKTNLIFLFVFLLIISSFIIIVAAENFGSEVSTCDAEDSATKGEFADACDATDGSNLESDDGTLETHTYRHTSDYGGVRIQTVNTSEVGCESIDQVFICYEWWSDTGDSLTDCDVSVDADGGGSYTTINSSCPGSEANPGIACLNVTANETWVCGNFFGASGTRGLAKSELTRTNAGAASTANWDVLFFNVTYTLDTTTPEMTIAEPQNSTYTTSSLQFNFSASDTNLQSCWYTNDSGITNTTLANCANTTYSATEGSTTISFYANDSSNNINGSESVTFFVDSMIPSLNFVSPTQSNGAYISTNEILINTTATDNQLINITIRLYNSSHEQIAINTSSTSPHFTNHTALSDGTYYFNATSTDILSNINSSITRNLTIDTTFPLISYGSVTEADGANISSSSIFINTSVTETNEANITFILYNSTASVNETTFTDGTRNINISSLADGTYRYNISITDSANQINTTSTRIITLDTTTPLISIGTGTINNATSINFDSIYVNVSVTETNEKNITFYLYNITNTLTLVNQSSFITAIRTINWTGLAETTYFYNVSIVDDVERNNVTELRTIIIDTTIPGINLNAPSNDSISLDNFTLLNVTVTDNRDNIILKIYGSNVSDFNNNNSLLFKQTGLSTGSNVTYNWTSPVLNATPYTVLLMHFDLEFPENATFSYDETAQNNGTKSTAGQPSWNTTGKFAYALSFNASDDFLTISDSNTLDLNESFSISFWTYPTSLTSNQTFLSKGQSTTANYYIDYKTTTEIEFGFYNGAFRSVAVDASDLTVNQWNLITATLNDTSNISRVYINGIDKGSLQLNFDVLANSFDLKLGYFPGYNQNFSGLIDELIIYNKTLSQDEITNIYQLTPGKYYWRSELNDSASNINTSQTRLFNIGPIWTVTPTDLGSVSAALNGNVTLGTITLNNTHSSINVTINITHDFNGTISLNESIPINLTNKQAVNSSSIQVKINVTAPSSEGSTTILFNITGNNTNSGDFSLPKFSTVSVDLITIASNPFLITNFETSPSTVSQNNSGITLKASVVNKGQGDAQSVKITYTLSEGWINSSGDLSSGLIILDVDQQQNYSLTVDINSSASTGIVTLYANVSGLNATGGNLNSTYLSIGSKNITVNAVSAGAGPQVAGATVSAGGTSGSGGGGSSDNSAGGSIESVAFSEAIDVIRGPDGNAAFNISVSPRYKNSSLQNLILTITGYPEQYISISPSSIFKVNYPDSKKFKVFLEAPTYSGREEFNITATITGKLVLGTGTISDYIDKRNINLIIQEIALSPVMDLLDKAEKAIDDMKEQGFNIVEVEEFLTQAKQMLLLKRNKESFDLANRIIEIKDKAFLTDNLIRRIIEVNNDPRRSYLLTGNSIRDFESDNQGVPLRQLLTGNAVFSSSSVKEMITLSIAAFERGDYDTALERVQNAQTLLILERKGDIGLFLYLYWHFVLIGMVFFSISGIFGYKKYQKTSVTRKINDANKEEENIQKLMIDSQRNYFTGKLSTGEYHGTMAQHQKRIAQIRKIRINLRNKRIKMLKPQKVIENLRIEILEIESEIKKLQVAFYKDRKISEKEYELQFKAFNERLAEIEGERTTLNVLKGNKRIKVEDKEKNILRSRDESRHVKRVKPIKVNEVGDVKGSLIGKFRSELNSIKNSSYKIARKIGGDKAKKKIIKSDSRLIDHIKEQLKGKNVKGKWIHINYKQNKSKDNLEKPKKFSKRDSDDKNSLDDKKEWRSKK